ncbi:MAG: transporter substrate-binding domain-containing protein [Deltaproteobacteria bacterium]|nr:transporter substrate-binding domain-containing protein [Deltaproteobacteria bacterium]
MRRQRTRSHDHRVLMSIRLALCLFVVMLLPALPPESLAGDDTLFQKPDIALTEQERAWLDAHPVLKIASDRDMAPYGFVDEQGRYVGVLPDIAARIERLLGIRIQFNPIQYSTLIDLVRDGAAEAAALVDPLDVPIAPHYLMTDEVMFMPYGLFVRTDSKLAQHTPETITGKTIALIEGWDLKNPSLDPLRGNLFVFADSYLAAVTLVLHGRADAFFDVLPATNYLLARNFIKDIKAVKIYHQGYPAAFFVHRQYPELYSAMQKALAAIPRQERMQLLQKWNVFMDDAATSLAMLDLHPDERAWLAAHPVIRVGIDANWAPLEFVDSDGLSQGIAPDYLRQFENMLGVRFDIQYERPWHEYLAMADRGEIDMLSGVVETPQRADLLAFTRPYIAMPVVILTRSDVAYIAGPQELDGKRVAVVRGYALEEWLARDYPGIEVVTAECMKEMFRLLNTNEVYACVGSLPSAGYYLGLNGHEDIKVSGQTRYTYRVSMAARRDYAPLVAILQKAFDAIPAEQHEVLQRRWMTLPRESVPDYSLL